MPIYEYKGQQYDITTEDPAEAKAKILGYLEKQPPAPTPKVPDFAGNPALSPQEQAYAAATPSSAGIRSLLKTPAKPPAEFTLSPEEQVMSAIGAPSTEPTIAQPPKEPRPPSEARPMEELGKGVESAAKIALPSMWEQASVLKDVGALGTVQKRLDLFDKIETGEITSPDQLRGLDISTSQARAYFGADPAMREKIRERTIGEIGRRKDFVAASINTLDQYQKDAVKYTGRTANMTDIENVKDFTNWLAYYAGNLPVQMAPLILAGAATGPAGLFAVSAPMGAAQALGDRLQFIQEKIKDLPDNQKIDAITDYIKKTGDTTLAIGIINGALDTALGPIATLAKRGVKEVVIGETKKKAFKEGLKEIPKGSLEEALQEGAQQGVQIAGQVREKEKDEFFTEENIKDILNNAAAGMLGGVIGGGVTTGARVYGAKTGEQIRADILAKALEEGAKGATVNQTAIDELVRQLLSPNAGVRQGTNIRANVPSLEITPPTARPGEPPAPPSGGTPIAPLPADITGLTAAPSESMDTEAMLREALGQPPATTLPPVNVETQNTAFDPTGWTQKENKINEKTGEPIYQPGTMVFEKTDEAGTHRVVTRNGVISQSTTNSPAIEIINSYLTSDEDNGKISGKIQIDNKTGKLIFVEDGERGQVIKMSPRAEQQYKEGVPLEKIAETEFSDAGGIRPDGTRTPHTTTAAFKAKKPSAVIPTAQQPKTSTEIQPKVAEAGPFVRKQMEAQTPTTPTPLSIEGALSGIETPKAKQAEAQGEQAPAAPAERLTLDNLKDRPIEEQYTIINTVSFNAKKAFRDGRISQDQLDKIQAERDRIVGEFDKKTLSNPTPDQKQALDLADQIEAAGQKDFADTVRNSVKRGIFRKDSIPFYQEKLQEFQAKQGKTEAKEEGFKWSEFLDPNEQKYYDTFQKTASPEAKAAFGKVESSIQDVTKALNNLGYQVNDTKFPIGLGNLKTQYSNLLSDGLKLLRDHYAIQNEYKRADADKFNLSIKRANDSAAQAQQVIRKAVPRPQEVTEAEQRVTEGEKAVSKIKGKPGLSLWTALTGKLGSSDIAELFGKSPQIYQKKLQAKKGSSGKSIADMVSDGDLDEFLPFQMRSNVPGFDGQEAEEYIKDQVRGQNYIPYSSQVEIEQIFGSVEEAEKLINDYLTIEEQNLELQEAADEQREAEINARSIEPKGEIPSTEPDEGEALTKPTPEGLRAKEKYRIEQEEKEAAKAKADKEAEDRAKADREVGEFTLTGSNRAADIAVAQGQKDIFAQEEETPTKTENIIRVNGRDIPVTMHRLEKENQLVEVNSSVFDKAFSKTTWQYVGKGGEGGIEGRYKKFAEFIKDARSIEAPNVSVDKDGAIVFGDGRHRYAYLRDSGVKNIPLSMDAESIKNAEKFGYVSKPIEAKPEPVETPEGRNLRYPMASVLFNDGYEVLALNDPRTYVDKGGEPHRTFEKDGVRVSLTPQLVLFQNKNAVLTGQGESTDLVINALLVDQAKRNQGKANEALQNIADAADKYGVTLYIEPVPIVNIKEKNFGLDRQQLEDLYKKFGFDFAEDSNKVMVREPEVEVLGPAEKPAAPRLTNEPYTIEGEFTEIGEEKQHALLEDQVSKLKKDQINTLEDLYGAKRGTNEFIERVRKDVIAFINQGAVAVKGRIRSIIRQLANGVLSVAIVFNPQFVSKPYTIAVPQYDIKTSEVIKDLPKEAQSMSDAAKRAYGVIYPALEAQLKANDKLFIVADKRSGNTYLFNPDGSLLLQSKTLFGKAIGDYMHGDNEIVANRITPAGVFDLGLRDAKRSAGEAYTAGDYDFGKVFVLDKSHMGKNGPYSNTIMHSVWTHETDAKQRLAALDKPGAEDSRYSFGCINVNKETFKYLITNHLNQMDGAKIFIVPENGANVMDFINGKAMYSDDIIRQKIEPVIKTTVTEKQVPAPKPGIERKQTGRETEANKLEVKTEEEAPGKEPKEPNEPTYYSIEGYAEGEQKKRSDSLKRTIKTLNRMRKDGRITDEQFVERADAAIAADEEQRLAEEPNERKRGFLHIQTRLNQAVDAKEISREARDLATWFMVNNEDLVSDLGISIIGKGKPGQGGQYDAYKRIMTIIKNGGSDLTTVHEILHHLERMMPTKVQQAIRRAWSSQLAKAAKAAKTPNEKLYFAALMEAHYGNGNIANIEVPKGAEKAYEQIKSLLEALQKGGSSEEFAMEMLKLGMVPRNLYEYFNPSEFWAVNGSDIVKARFDAVRGGVLARLKNWLKELGQKIKSLFGLKSDASIIRALDSLAKSDGKFVTNYMLGAGDYYSIQNYQGNAAPTALWDTVEPSFTDGLIYQVADKQVDTKRVIERINEKVGQIDERLDAYTKETLYHGRSAERIKNFLEEDFRPLLEQMKEQGITVDELEKYLHNRHAEERNEQINKINLSPDVQDVGSGIKTTDAQDYLANLPAAEKAKLERFASKIDDIIEGTQEMLVDGGLETQDTIDQWNKTYKHYVPLQRDDLDFVHTGSGYVGGVGTKGGASKRAVGSVKPVKDILLNIATQREKAIRRAEQAKVGRALYALAITSPNPKFWLPVNPNAVKNRPKLIQEMVSLGLTIQDAENLIRPLQTPSIDKTTGLVRYDVNPAQYNSKNVFPVRINGEDRFIIFNPKDERAMRMAMSLKNLDADQLGFVLGNIGAVTRWIASINTQYNPVFGAWNMTRDVQSAAFNLSTTEIAGKEKAVLAGTLPAMFAIWKSLRNKPASSPKEQALMDLFDQMRLAGGTTGFAQQFSGQGESFGKFVERMRTGAPKEKVNIVEQEMKRLDRGNVKKAAQKLFDWLSDYNDAMENAVRLSAFKVSLDQGLSEQKAASIAKELTVNFNRKGAASPTFQALYAFINASVQGTARLIKTLNGPTGKKIIAGGIALGVIQAIALALNGYDDGDPPEFLKDKNFIIPIPFAGNNYIILPMPPGLNVFPGIGRIITEAVLIKGGLLKSNQGLGDKALSVGSLILDSFNPLGAGSFTQMIAPTAFDPLFAIAANKDAFGRPIYKKDMSTQPTPGYERSRPTATFISQGIAEFLNFITSPVGTKHTKGLISPTADEIDYLAGQYFGGVGREIIKGVGSIKASAEGEEVPAYKIPVVGKLYGETKTPAAISAKFYDNVSQMAEYEHEIKKRIQNKEPVEEYKKANPESKLWQQANNVENRIAKLNKEKKIYLEKNDTKNAQRIEEMRVKAMRDFNDKVRAAQ